MDIRTQILDAATRRFAAHGVDAASLSAIASDVGVRKPSLLYHFSSKDILHQAVLDQVLSHWNEVLPRLLEAAAGDDRFDALLDETIRFFVADADRARLLLREVLDRPDAMRRRLAEAVQPWMKVIAGYVRRGQESGELRPDADPEAYLLHVIHMVVGGIAVAETLGTVLSRGAGRGDVAEERTRLAAELKRVARVSLFTDEGLEAVAERRRRRESDSP